MKSILIGLLFMSLQAMAAKPAVSACQQWGIEWVACTTNDDSAECGQCLKAHAQCLLVTMEPDAVVAADVEACDAIEHSCLTSNQCRNKQ
jgi:biotin carboxylase